MAYHLHDPPRMDQMAFAAEPGYHGVQFYSDDVFLCDVVTDFVAEGLGRSQPALVIATAEHRVAIATELRARGIDVDEHVAAGTLRLLDAHETLALFMVNGWPDPQKCKAAIGAILAEMSGGKRNRVVHAYGEMVDVLWREGHPDAAINLEVLWNELAMTHSFALLCGYSQAHVSGSLSIRNVCSQHTHVLPNRDALS